MKSKKESGERASDRRKAKLTGFQNVDFMNVVLKCVKDFGDKPCLTFVQMLAKNDIARVFRKNSSSMQKAIKTFLDDFTLLSCPTGHPAQLR